MPLKTINRTSTGGPQFEHLLLIFNKIIYRGTIKINQKPLTGSEKEHLQHKISWKAVAGTSMLSSYLQKA